MCVADGRCFRSGGACNVDRRCSGIGRRDDSFYQKGFIESGGEGEAQLSESATAAVGDDGCHIRF